MDDSVPRHADSSCMTSSAECWPLEESMRNKLVSKMSSWSARSLWLSISICSCLTGNAGYGERASSGLLIELSESRFLCKKNWSGLKKSRGFDNWFEAAAWLQVFVS